MTENLNPTQADALAVLIRTLREDWGIPGIKAALWEAKDRGNAWDVTHAALYCAQDLAIRTPAVIAMPGPHWTRGRELGTATGVVAKCERDGHQGKPLHNCPYCRAEQLEAPPPPDTPPTAGPVADRIDVYDRGRRAVDRVLGRSTT